MPQRILEPGEIELLSNSEIPFLRLPDRASLLVDRAARLRQLANGHAMGDYLRLIAEIAEVQSWALENAPPFALPSDESLEQSRAHGMPPLGTQMHHRDPAWCDLLRRMLRRLAERTRGAQRDVIVRLDRERDELYEAQASKLLAGITLGLDMAYAPLLGAALQVYWVHLVTTLGRGHFGRIDPATVCPACGSRPVASIARIGGQESGYRYLHCSLCATEWHMVRIKCTTCESTKGIQYHGIEGGTKAVLAESCDECNTYLKILYMDRDAQVEPIADDLASTALDLLMADTGKLRSGQNLMLIHGDAED
ncbi:MAG TPA: formate dehydrogenase accessory protein FdhE [Burkholderiales bacterium]|nr:formate dehydrogenase accessory protein FdhE [Burkholderiales bacterium]